MSKIVLSVILTLFGFVSKCQNIPVLKASSTTVDIRDGNNFRDNYWTIIPEARPDIYYAQRSKQAKKVTFYTDLDSISFDVKPGGQYDFIILLNGKDSCHTRISTLRKTYTKQCQACPIVRDTLKFTLKSDNKIHFAGSINGSTPLDFIFDTGADQVVLYKNGGKKVKLLYDGQIENAGFGGTQTRKVSNRNRLALGQMIWNDEAVMFVDNQADDADGIIGFNVFEDKVVEINFDDGYMIIHDGPLMIDDHYAKFPIQYKGTLPQISADLKNGAFSYPINLVFDMGAKGSVFITKDDWDEMKLGQLRKIGQHTSRGVGGSKLKSNYVVLPELAIGKHTLSDVPIDIATQSPEGWVAHSLLGMDVLKRFNMVIDYQQHLIYLKPNKLRGQLYLKADQSPLLLGIAGFAGIAVIAYWLWRRKIVKRVRQHSAAIIA